ncbi:MAG: glycosyltransferase, partial [Maribacter arcticus]|uniref:glycosyltransferase n=1 Tax=Maribacter arcticus TaxID=561365 RepID=UPI00300178D4
MTNILVTTTTFPKNDMDTSPRFVFDLCEALAIKQDFEIYVLAPHVKHSKTIETKRNIKIKRYRYSIQNLEVISGNGIINKLKKNKMYILLTPFLFIFQIINIVKISKRNNIKLIIAHWILPQGLCAVIAKLFFLKGVKIITISHGGDASLIDNNRYLKPIGKFIIKKSDLVISVSSYIRNKIISFSGTDKEIKVLSMGVDHSKFNMCSLTGHVVKKYDFIFIGRLEEKKGVEYLVKAIKLLEGLGTRTIIIGDGSERTKLEALSCKNDLENNITFTGSLTHDEIISYMKESRIFVAPSINMPSDTEGMPTTILEAMSAGLPIITTDAGGITDVIKNKLNGLVTPQRSPESLSV